MKPLFLSPLLAGTMLAFSLAAQDLPLQISGTVRDTNGLPAQAGLEVAVYPTRGLSFGKTDSNGHYQIKIALLDTTLTYTPVVIVRDPDRNLAAMADIGAGNDIYDLQLAPGFIICGRVEDEQGDPASNATLDLRMSRGQLGWSLDGIRPPTVDAQGRFEIRALPTEQAFTVVAGAKGCGTESINVVFFRIRRIEVPPFKLKRADKMIAGTVLSPEGKPVPGANVRVLGRGQPRASLVTDQNGRFASDVCEGDVTLNVWSSPTAIANVQAEPGDTNLAITLGKNGTFVRLKPRPALLGNPLPDLTPAGIPSGILQTNKPLLICLFDPEQRSSRRALRLLAERKDLKDKGFQIVCIPAALMTADSLKEWKQSNPQPFPVGGVTQQNDTTKWILSPEKVPWLIATDPQWRVKAEGFELDDLDTVLK